MPDPFKPVRPGDPILIAAPAWNAMLGAGRAYLRAGAGGTAGPLTSGRSSTIIRVKNESGSDLLRGHVLGLDTPIFDPTSDEDAALREVTFRGNVPADYHKGRFGVLLEPIADGRVGRCVLDGVCWARVNVSDDGHRYADVTVGSTDALGSDWVGGAKILWSQGDGDEGYGYSGEAYDTGEQWAAVQLGAQAPQGQLLKLTSSITARSGTTVHSGTATYAKHGSGTLSASTEAVGAVWNLTDKTIASGSYVLALWADGAWWVTTPDSCGHLS